MKSYLLFVFLGVPLISNAYCLSNTPIYNSVGGFTKPPQTRSYDPHVEEVRIDTEIEGRFVSQESLFPRSRITRSVCYYCHRDIPEGECFDCHHVPLIQDKAIKIERED